MSFAKGQPIELASYLTNVVDKPTYSNSGTLVAGLFGTTDKTTGKIPFYTQSSQPRLTYNVRMRWDHLTTGTTSSFIIYDSDASTILFQVDEGQSTPTTNTPGWDYNIILGDGGPDAEGDSDVKVYIPPSANKYYWEMIVPGGLFTAGTVNWDIDLHQAQNDMQVGWFVTRWSNDFSHLVTASYDGGLSFVDAQKGYFGGSETYGG